MFSSSLKFVMLLAGGACLAMLSAPQAATAANFAGKTIEVIVPSGAGGGLTRNALADSQRIFLSIFPVIPMLL